MLKAVALAHASMVDDLGRMWANEAPGDDAWGQAATALHAAAQAMRACYGEAVVGMIAELLVSSPAIEEFERD